MSLCLILQEKDSVFIGADTALSVYNGNKFVRKSNDGKKLFEIGKDIVYCSGDMSYVPGIIKNMKIKNGYVDVEHISKYLKGKNFRKCPVFDVISISVIICRVVGGNSYVYALEPENNFDIVTHIGKQEGTQIWVGGIYNDRCLEIATEEIKKNHGEVINTYTNTYKRMACDEIGGNLNVYYLNPSGYRKIIENYDLNDGYKTFSYIGLNHSIIADAIVGNLIAGKKMFIGNTEKSVIITGDGIMISNGVIKSSDYEKYGENHKNASIIDLRDGSFSFAGGGLSYRDGNLVLKDGVIQSANYIPYKSGSIIDLTHGNFNFAGGGLTYDSDEGDNNLQVTGDIKATSIVADYAYKINDNGKKIDALQGFVNEEGLWSVRLWINENSYIHLDCTEDKKHSNINLNAKNINFYGNLYSSTGQITTSDRNLKDNITPLSDRHIKFFSLLQPVSFTFIDGTSGRTHIGFISQDVEDAMTKAGLTDLDFAGFCKTVKTKEVIDADGNKTYETEKDENGNPVYIYALRYEEFIALNTFMIQKLYKDNQDMRTEIQDIHKENQNMRQDIKKIKETLGILE